MPGSDPSYYASALDGGATVSMVDSAESSRLWIRDAVKEAVTGLCVSLHEISALVGEPE